MKYMEFNLDKKIAFGITGKFVSPNRNWIHISRSLCDFEFIVMTKGTLYIAEDEHKYELHEGDWMVCCPPCHQYGYKPSECEFYWTHFTYNDHQNDPLFFNDNTRPELPYPLGEKKILLPVHGRIPDADRLMILLKQLQDSDRRYQNINLNSLYISTILSELYSQLYLNKGIFGNTSANNRLYTDILDYISWRIHDNIKVKEIADYLGFNSKYITTFFKKRSGLSIKQYILRKKISLAQGRLSESDTPIGVIAMELGFSDSQGFSNTFRKLTGQSPSAYRNTYGMRKEFYV